MDSPDSGMFGSGGIYSAVNEAARDSQAIQFYTNGIADPNIVGIFWYGYVDQPLYGNTMDMPNTSNYNTGLVDITDTPYYPLISAFQQFHRAMYSLRN